MSKFEELNEEELISYLEENFLDLERKYEIVQIYWLLIKRFEENHNSIKKKEIETEIKIYNYKYDPDTKKFTTWNGTYDSGDITYFNNRINQTRSPFIKKKIALILWENETPKNFQNIKIYIDSAINCAEVCYGKNMDWEATKFLSEAFKLAKNINNEELLSKCLDAHMNFIQKYCENNRRWIYEIIESILENGIGIKEKIDYEKLKNLIDSSIELNKNENEFHFVQMYFDLLIIYWDVLKNIEEKRKVMIRKADYQEFEGEWKNKNGKNNLILAHCCEIALKIYLDLGGFPEKVDELKIKIREAYKEGEKEMAIIDVPFSITPEQIQQFLKDFEGKELYNYFQILVDTECISPYSYWYDFSKKPENQSISSQILPTRIIQNNISKGTFSNEDATELNAIRNCCLELQLFSIFLDELFKQIEQKFENYPLLLINFLENSGIISKRRMKIIRHGISKFKEKDYIGTIHVIVFQIEGILRDLLIKLGEPEFKVIPNKQEFYLFGRIIEILRSKMERHQEIIDLLKLYEIVLINDLGFNMRNLIGHGFFDYLQFNRTNALLLIYILLKITKFSKFIENKPIRS